MWYLFIGALLIILDSSENLVKAAACKGPVHASLEVTGAFVKSNNTIYSIKSNEYATFTCVGIADEGVARESTLKVDCKGSSKFRIKSASGTGSSVTAKWQSNDGCQFNSQCSIQCSASTDCKQTNSQQYTVVKDHNVKLTQINCTENYITECTNKTQIFQQLTRQKPLGTGTLAGSTTCPQVSRQNSSVSYQFLVLPAPSKCSCSTTFSYRERDSTGYLCTNPVWEKQLQVRNSQYCKPKNLVALWVVLALVGVAIVLGVLYKMGYFNKLLGKPIKPSKRQVKRMVTMDRDKLTELIAEANNPAVGTGHLQLEPTKDDPLYDEI